MPRAARRPARSIENPEQLGLFGTPALERTTGKPGTQQKSRGFSSWLEPIPRGNAADPQNCGTLHGTCSAECEQNLEQAGTGPETAQKPAQFATVARIDAAEKASPEDGRTPKTSAPAGFLDSAKEGAVPIDATAARLAVKAAARAAARWEPPDGRSDVTGGPLNAIEATRVRRGLSIAWLGKEAESGARVCRDCLEYRATEAAAALAGQGFTMWIFRGRSQTAEPCRVCGVPVLGQVGEGGDRSTARDRWARATTGATDHPHP